MCPADERNSCDAESLLFEGIYKLLDANWAAIKDIVINPLGNIWSKLY